MDGAIAHLTVKNGATLSAGSGTLLNARNASTVTAVADGVALTGNVISDASSQLNLTLQNGTVLTGMIDPVALTVDATSAWNVTANSSLSSFTNAGTVSFVAPTGNPALAASYKTITTNGYAGQGGLLAIHTHLGADNSPTDRLIVDGGAATGNTTLKVNNTGGAGAMTLSNGVEVVSAINGGTTAAGAFSLQGGSARAGAYDYRLFHGGITGAAADAHNWYLRSTFVAPITPITPTTPDAPINPVTPGTPAQPTAPAAPPVVLPIYGPELSVYAAAAPTAARLGLDSLGTLHDRIGEAANLRQDRPGSSYANGAWGRVFGGNFREQYRTPSQAGTRGSDRGVQVGLDLYRSTGEGGARDVAGVYYTHVNGRAEVDGRVTNAAATGYLRQRTGSISLDGNSLGAYYTHLGSAGGYVDAVLQASRYSGAANTGRANLPLEGHGSIASIEGGYPIALAPDLVLEPQAQVIHQRVSLDAGLDRFGSVGFDRENSTYGRIGARLRWTGEWMGWKLQPYARANLWTQRGGRTGVTFGGVDHLATGTAANWAQVGFGLTAQLDKKVSVYAHIDRDFSIGARATARRGVSGAAGVRVNW